MDGNGPLIFTESSFRMVGEDALESIEVRPVKEESVDLLDQLVAKARENGVLSELPAEQEILKRN